MYGRGQLRCQACFRSTEHEWHLVRAGRVMQWRQERRHFQLQRLSRPYRYRSPNLFTPVVEARNANGADKVLLLDAGDTGGGGAPQSQVQPGLYSPLIGTVFSSFGVFSGFRNAAGLK